MIDFLNEKPKKSRTTTILINEDDYKFIKKNGMSPTRLLRLKIYELKSRREGKQRTSEDYEKIIQKHLKIQEMMTDKITKILKIFSETVGDKKVLELTKGL